MNILYASRPVTFDDVSLSWLPGFYDGTSVLKPNGKFLSVQPNGSYEERDSVGGTYEQFGQGPVNTLLVTPDKVSYAIAVKQN